MNWQLFDAFGIFLGFAANLIVSQTGDNRWRYEVASVVIPTLILLRYVPPTFTVFKDRLYLSD